jgi:hypothetical protein
MNITQQVVDILNQKGIKSYHEYPGFISIPIQSNMNWAIGNINETWGGNIVDDKGNQCDEGFCTDIPSDSEDAQVIADAIEKEVLLLSQVLLCLEGLS